MRNGSGKYRCEQGKVVPPVFGYRTIVGNVVIDTPDGRGTDIVLNRTKDHLGPLGWYNGYYVLIIRSFGERKYAEFSPVRMEGNSTCSGPWITWLKIRDIKQDGFPDITATDRANDKEWSNRGGSFPPVAP